MPKNNRPKYNVEDSQVTILHKVMPEETNPHGTLHGGNLLHHIDSAGAICAVKHAHMPVVTASVIHMDFFAPATPGIILSLHASVNCVFNTSMEIGVRIVAENPITGDTAYIGKCYLLFVGTDKAGRPVQLPDIEIKTDTQARRKRDAHQRKAFLDVEKWAKKNSPISFSFPEKQYVLMSFGKKSMSLLTKVETLPRSALFSYTNNEEQIMLFIEKENATSFVEEAVTCVTYSRVDVIFNQEQMAEPMLSLIVAFLKAKGIQAITDDTIYKKCIFVPQESLPKAFELFPLLENHNAS